MNADRAAPASNGKPHEVCDIDDFPHKDLTYAIVGCAMRVLNEIGNGYHEKPYENALAIEFTEQGWAFEQQPRFPIYYHRRVIGEYIPDLVVGEAVIVDAKVIDSIGPSEIGQMLNYLKTTNMEIGIILNFRHAKLDWKRIVRDPRRHQR